MEEADIIAQKVRRAQKPQVSAYMGLGLVLKVPQGSFPQLLHQVMVVMLLSLPALPTVLLPQTYSGPMSGTACAKTTDQDTSDHIQY